MEQVVIRYRHNAMQVPSLSVFMNIKGGMNHNCRDVYFIRLLGQNEHLAADVARMDETLTLRMASGRLLYRRMRQLPAPPSPEEAEVYARCYLEWLSCGRERMRTRQTQTNDVLAQVLSNGCKMVLDCYHTGRSGVSETMERNLLVKLLYWFDQVAGDFLKHWDERCCMKLVAENIRKEPEYLFFYLLTLIGADVLLLQTEGDAAVCTEWKKLSAELVVGAYGSCRLPPCPKPGEVQTGSDPRSGEVQIEGSLRQDGVQTGRVPRSGEDPTGRGQRPGEMQTGCVAKPQGKRPVRVHIPERSSRHPSAARTSGQMEEGRSAVSGFGQRPRSGNASNASAWSGSGQSRPESGRLAAACPSPASGAEKSFEELARLASSVVMIAVHERSGEVVATGSGIMIGPAGYILTNHHVLAGGSYYSVRIEEDERIYNTDEIIKYHNVLDLAVLRIERRLRPIPIYRGTKGLVRGQRVVAIGSPMGLFNSVSDGIISGFRRIDEVDMIQFTAPTSHGSSGGAVLNLQGEVIGISTAGIDSGQNLNLAVGYECINQFVRGFTS